MHINDLENGQKVLARTGRAGRTAVEWDHQGRFIEHTLYVARDKQCKVCTVTTTEKDWAEGGPNDLCPDQDGQGATFVVEDYYLQIQGLEANWKPNG